MKRVLGVFGVVAVVVGHGTSGALADVRGERESAMKGIGGAMRMLSQVARADTIDTALATRAAEQVASTAKAMDALFPAGSQANSRTRPELWTNRAAFTAVAADFSTAADRLLVAARAGDKAAMNTAIQEVGNGCNACHYQFRMAR